MKIIDDKKLNIHYLIIFATAIVIHWIIVLMGYASMKISSPDISIIHFLGERFKNAGDAIHYTYIAEYGYQSVGETANKIVFYPLYPLCMKILWYIVRDYAISGILISQICYGISVVYLYKLTSLDYTKKQAYDSVICLIVYPFAIFTFGIFTEGLFLMLSIMTLYYISKHNWLLVGIFGFLSALSRTQGMLLFAPAVYEYIVTITSLKEPKFSKKIHLSDIGILGAPLGFVVYLFINKIIQGDAFAFIAHEEAAPWYQTTKWINENISKDYGMALEHISLGYIIYWVQIILYFLGVGCMLYAIKRKMRTSYIVYGGIYICFTYLSGWMLSGGRYMMGCIPLYLLYASIENPYIKRFLLTLSTLLCILYSILFIQGQSIM